MKRIRMKAIMAGPNGNASPGDIIEVSDDEYKNLIKGHYGEPVEPQGKFEKDKRK